MGQVCPALVIELLHVALQVALDICSSESLADSVSGKDDVIRFHPLCLELPRKRLKLSLALYDIPSLADHLHRKILIVRGQPFQVAGDLLVGVRLGEYLLVGLKLAEPVELDWRTELLDDVGDVRVREVLDVLVRNLSEELLAFDLCWASKGYHNNADAITYST